MFENWCREIEGKLDAIQTEVNVRSRPEDYPRILQRVLQFKNTVGSADTVCKLYTKVFTRLERSAQENSIDVNTTMETQSMIRECKAWLSSCDQFVNSMTSEFSEFADIFTPIVYAVSMVSIFFRMA